MPLNGLTVLSGTNASGKSTVLQGLVLLSQVLREHEWADKLLLNGPDLQMGTITDVVNKLAGRRSFRIGLDSEHARVSWSFEASDRRAMSADIANVRLGEQYFSQPRPLQRMLPREADLAQEGLVKTLSRLCYLTAERLGPRDLYALQESGYGSAVGSKGEFAVSHLYSQRDDIVSEELLLRDHPPTLLRQVEARMQQFFANCALELSPVPQTNSVTLGIRTSDSTDFHRPTHVGFGLTQVLPIIVAALSAPKGDLLLLENPEVHLHPGGQAQMGRFLAEVAGAGVQILLETHSDHILSGIRRAVKSQAIDHNQVTLHFLTSDVAGAIQMISPVIDSQGNLDNWPDGFFDQFDKDSNFFAGWA